MYVSTKGCTYGKCTCDWAADLTKERDERQVHQFLMGLDDDVYGNIRTNIIAQDLLSFINRAYALVVQEERHKNMTKGKEGRSEVVSFVVRKASSSNSTPRQRNNKAYCTNCEREGHDISSCFEINGYPNWWTGPRWKNNSSRRVRGGASSSTRAKGGSVGVGHAAHSNSTFKFSSQDRSDAGAALNHEQWNTVINMFKSLASNNNKASTSEKTFCVLFDFHDILPCLIMLPDGRIANDVHEGTVNFSDKLQVRNDHNSRMVIGVGEAWNGVFRLRVVALQTAHCKAVSINTYQTWHRRLG
nr:hypothetical protein [Tanacetum cinerariifolium]